MIVQMSGLGQEQVGRFGNQLFAYFFLKVVEAELGCEIRTPTWLGETVFKLPATAPLLPPEAGITFEGQGDPPRIQFVHQVRRSVGPQPELDVIAGYQNRGCSVLEIEGSYQYHMATYAHHRALHRSLFRLNPLLEAQLDQALARVGLGERPLVCAHIRRGDYPRFQNQHPLFWSVGIEAVAKALQDLHASGLRDPLLYVASDDLPYCRQAFEAMRQPFIASEQLFTGLDTQTALMTDFMVMTRADVLMAANSSLSVGAATMNERARLFLRPCPREERLIPFDPWHSHVLLARHPYQVN